MPSLASVSAAVDGGEAEEQRKRGIQGLIELLARAAVDELLADAKREDQDGPRDAGCLNGDD
jgi:hypothetical protein